MLTLKLFKNKFVNLMSIIVQFKGVFCLGWKNALGALATQQNKDRYNHKCQVIYKSPKK